MYNVTFLKQGLLIGTSCSLTFSTALHSSRSPILTLAEQNGSYNYNLSTVSGYNVSPESGVATVHGGPLYISVESKAAVVLGPTPSSRVLGLPPKEGWALIEGVIVVGVLVICWAILRTPRQRPTEDFLDSSGRPSRYRPSTMTLREAVKGPVSPCGMVYRRVS
ncbi:MAG: hypothetical protein WA688_02535 [Thermoplasmata archaeon]